MTVSDLIIHLLKLPLDSEVRFPNVMTKHPLPKEATFYIRTDNEWKVIEIKEEKNEQRTSSP